MRPTFDSLKVVPKIGRETILFKEAQAAMPGDPMGGMSPEVGQSPQTGNPDEMQAPESANQRQFEDDFGSLAYQFVQDRAPALIPYMLGFEVVDRNDDGSKAVGIFGYKVDDDFYYIPAFFLNNQVRGVDMILNKKTNQFVPLTEKWIDFIINRHSVSIGGPADDRVRETMRNPDLSFVQRPQVAMGKIASSLIHPYRVNGKMVVELTEAEGDKLSLAGAKVNRLSEEEEKQYWMSRALQMAGAKAAEAESDSSPWTPKEAWRHIKEATAKIAEDPMFKEAFLGIIEKGKLEKCAESKYIKNFMEKVGGPECMSSMFKAMHDVDFANAFLSLYKDAEAIFTDKLVNASIHVDRMKKIAAAKPKVRIVKSTEGLAKIAQDTPASDVGGDDEDKPLTVEENARQIIEHDFTIEDVRPKEETSKVTDDQELVDFEHRFQPPDSLGRYNFVMADGVTREGILLNPVVSPSCGKENSLVVFEDDGNILAESAHRALITTEFDEDSKKDDTGNDLKALYDKATDISDIEINSSDRDGTPYLFIDEKGNAAGPFFIKFVFADGDNIRFGTGYGYNAVITTYASKELEPHYGFMDWDLRDKYHDSDGRKDNYCGDKCCESCNYCDFITIGSFSGIAKKTSDGVIIPHDWKALKIKIVPKYAEYNENESQEDRLKREAKVSKARAEFESKYTFGHSYDILESMKSDGVERIKIASDGTDFYIHVDGAKKAHGPMNYKSAAIDLVTRFGMRPRRTFATLAKVASAGSVRLLVGIPSLVKSAQVGNLVNVAMPAPLEQLPATDPYSGVPVYSSPYIDETHGQFTGVPGLPPEGGMTRGINIGGEMERNMGGQEIPDEHSDSFGSGALPIDEEARRLAEEAAAAGQRHVFDQAAIGGLVKVYDTANVVDSYIPDFMDTIDRLGRILFLFYWKHEDFNQRYGSDDVVQMEDSLRNVFKQLGELTLHLKEKAVHKE